MSVRTSIETQLEKLSPRDKKLLTGLAMFVGVAGLLIFTVTLVGLQRSLEADVSDAKDTLMQLRLQQAQYDTAQAQLTAQETRIKENQAVALSAHVEKIAEELGVSEGLKDAQRGEIVEELGITRTKWKIVLKGRTYDEAVNFLLQLERSGYPLKVENTRLKKVTVKREPAVDLTLDVTTFKIAKAD